MRSANESLRDDWSEFRSALGVRRFCKESAADMKGRELLRKTETDAQSQALGDCGIVVATKRKSLWSGDRDEYLIGVEWTDSKSYRSNIRFYSQEQIRQTTRPLQRQAEMTLALQRRMTSPVQSKLHNKSRKRSGRKF